MRIRIAPFNAISVFNQAKLIEKAQKAKGNQVKIVKYISSTDAVRKTADAYIWMVVANPSWIAHIGGIQHSLRKNVGDKAVCYATIEGIPYPHMAASCGARWIDFTANSHFTKECLETAGLKVSRVIHHAIDLDEVAAVKSEVQRYRAKLDNDFPSQVRFIYVGRDDHRKNIMGLIEAVDILNQHHKDQFVVFLITESANLQKYERPNIRFVGTCGNEMHETLMTWMGACDFFTFPSVSEGFGVPVLESLAMGTPVVCNKIPPLTEFTNESVCFYYPWKPPVEYMKTGAEQYFMMHRYDPADYASAMLRAIQLKQHPKKYRDMRISAAIHAAKWDCRKIYSDIV